MDKNTPPTISVLLQEPHHSWTPLLKELNYVTIRTDFSNGKINLKMLLFMEEGTLELS